jgi:hypothetical protein
VRTASISPTISLSLGVSGSGPEQADLHSRSRLPSSKSTNAVAPAEDRGLPPGYSVAAETRQGPACSPATGWGARGRAGSRSHGVSRAGFASSHPLCKWMSSSHPD